MVDHFTLDDDVPGTTAAPDRPNLLLTIELVPSSSWGDNLRSRLVKADWDKLRKHCYRLADYKCEVCGGSGRDQGYDWPVECHEVWSYNEDEHVQKLERLIALCPKCHLVKHIGFAQIKGKEDEARAHLQRVNKWTADKAKAHIREAFAVWQVRSQRPWTLDLAYLAQHGIGIGGAYQGARKA